MSKSFFSDANGRWIDPENEYIGDLNADLKTIMAGLSNPTNELYDEIDQVLYQYFEIIRHGETRLLGKNIEWVLFESAVGRVVTSYKDGSEWVDERFSEELPKWLLNAILRQLGRKKPLGDQAADEVLQKARDVETEYIANKARESTRGIKLNARRFKTRRLCD